MLSRHTYSPDAPPTCASASLQMAPGCACLRRKPEFMMFQVNQDDTEGLKAEIDVSH